MRKARKVECRVMVYPEVLNLDSSSVFVVSDGTNADLGY